MIERYKVGLLTLLLLSYPAVAAFGAQDASKAVPETQEPKPPSPTPTPNDPSQKEPGKEPEIKVSLKDGVHFKSSDGNFDIILGGYVGIQYRAFAHRPDDNV